MDQYSTLLCCQMILDYMDSLPPTYLSLANGHLGCFHILAVMNNAAVNPCEPMSLVLLGVYLGVELLGCMRTLCITF